MTLLVTGAAGFIGSHVAAKLLDRGDKVVGIDNINSYYDPDLKKARLTRLGDRDGFTFERVDISDKPALDDVFARYPITRVVHLAAQAGVRYSLIDPDAYAQSNLVGFVNILEACRHGGTEHLVYASTSSVYGLNTEMPLSVTHGVDHPISLYSASKRANELMAHSYSHLFGLPTTGLRFFTVYGPWGRPDMALFIFTRKILAGEPIDLFNEGRHSRDFTFIDDIADGVIRAVDRIPHADPKWPRDNGPDPSRSSAPFRIYNLGNGKRVPLLKFVDEIEKALGKNAEHNYLPMQSGDVEDTSADISLTTEELGFQPSTDIAAGIQKFVAWYTDYYGGEV